MEAKIYDNKGKEKGTLTLSASVFGFPWNAELVRQVFLSERANARKVLAHTKDRSEVSGGGKKPWQQKGTGRARHGSSRSPIWVGGGISHGPRKDRDYMEKINKKAKRKAVLAILSQKLKDGEIFFMDDLSLPEAKTKNAREILGNIKNVSIKEARNLNASDLLSNKFLIIPKDASKVLEETFLK